MISLSNAQKEAQSGKEGSPPFESSMMARLLLDIEILYLLNFGPKSGYELDKDLASYFNLKLSYGTLYPHLHSLEKSHLVKGDWETETQGAALRKRNYSLTPSGRKTLQRNVEKLSKISLEMEFMFARIDLNHRQEGYPVIANTTLGGAKDFLESLGYSAKLGASVRGRSGKEYSLDLYATRQKEDGAGGESIALRLEQELELGDLLKLAAISEDIRVENFIVLVPRSVQEETLSLADLYHVLVYEGANIEQAVSNMRMRFGERTQQEYVVTQREVAKY